MKYGYKWMFLSCLGAAIASQACSDDDVSSGGEAGAADAGTGGGGTTSGGGKSSGGASGANTSGVTSTGGKVSGGAAGKSGDGGTDVGSGGKAGTGTGGVAGSAGTGGMPVMGGTGGHPGGAPNGGEVNGGEPPMGGDGGAGGAPGPDPLSVGLLLHYTFDEGMTTDIVDSSGNANMGHLGAFQWIAGNSGNALHIASGPPNGELAPVLLPATGVTDNVTDFTIGIWVRPTTLKNWERIFDFGVDQGKYAMLTPQNGDNGKPRFELKTADGDFTVDSSVPIVVNVWQHVAITQTGNTAVIYVNGVATGTSTTFNTTLKQVASTKNYLGKSQYPDAKYEGDFDDFKMYTRALAASEVMTLAGLPGGTAITPDTASINYKFNESKGFAVADSSGNAKDAQVEHGVVWSDHAPGKAIVLDWRDSYVLMPKDIMKNVSDFTMAAWVNEAVARDWAQLFDFGTDTNSYAALIASNGQTKTLRFSLKNGSEETVDGPALVPGTWTHVAVTRAGSTVTIYVNGVSAGVGIVIGNLPNGGATNNNWFGRSQFPDPLFDGSLDDMRVYSRALSADELLELAGG